MKVTRAPKFFRLSAITLLATGLMMLAPMSSAYAAESEVTPPEYDWTFSGPLGSFDKEQLQRGFQVYREVCSSCHGMTRVQFRTLAEPGGPAFSKSVLKGLAADFLVPVVDDEGDIVDVAAGLTDYIPSPWANDILAGASFGGAIPPDLSIITRARSYPRGWESLADIFTLRTEVLGADYLTALLDGYIAAPDGVVLSDVQYYNEIYPGGVIAMEPPLSDGLVTYEDGTIETTEQYSKDVSAFLFWASDPHMVERKALGWKVLLFMIFFAFVMYFTKKAVWRGKEAH